MLAISQRDLPQGRFFYCPVEEHTFRLAEHLFRYVAEHLFPILVIVGDRNKNEYVYTQGDWMSC